MKKTIKTTFLSQMLFEHITPSIIIPLVNKFPDSLIINVVYLTGLRLIKENRK